MTIKTLQQKTFKVEIDETETVSSFVEKKYGVLIPEPPACAMVVASLCTSWDSSVQFVNSLYKAKRGPGY